MAFFTFSIDQDNCDHEQLFGISFKVRTMDYPGFEPDPAALFQWSLPYVEDVIAGRLDRRDLIEEGVHLLITSADGKIIADSLKDRRTL